MILKKGSKGESVKALQSYLGLAADGDFGPKTEAAVRAWQTKNGLVADGIVGPKTWDAMGLATTDISERPKVAAKEVDHESFYLPPGEYMKGPVNKRWIFLHHTAGWHNPYNTISAWARDKRGAVATEWVLGGPSIKGNETKFDGTLVKAFPDGGYGWHLGTGNNVMHRESVAIELCNFGFVTKGGYTKWNETKKKNEWISLSPDEHYTYVGTEAHPSQIVTLDKPFRGHSTWHKYSDAQIEALKGWILDTADKYNIDPRKGLVEQIKLKGAHSAFDLCDVKLCERTPGMWLHTNVQKGKVDLFPQENLVEMLLSL